MSRTLWPILALALALTPSAHAQDSRDVKADQWGSVTGLLENQHVHVRLDDRTIKGRFVAADPASLTVHSKGTAQRVARDRVQQVRAVKPGREKFRLIGGLLLVAAGAISLASSIGEAHALSQDRFPDEQGLGRMLLPVAAAGAGGVMIVLGNFRPIYKRDAP